MALFGKLFGKKEDKFDDLGLGDDSFSADLGKTPGTDTAMPGAAPGAEHMPGTGLEMPETKTDFGAAPSAQQAEPAYPDLSKPYTAAPAFPHENVDVYRLSKEIEVVSSKIDAVKAAIESIGQRLANLERIAEAEPEKRKHW